jgi:cytidine deaminase
MCRQSLFELFGGDLEVICFNETEEKRAFMRDILPYGFRLDRPEIKKA